MEDDPLPLLVAINGSLRFRCVQGSRPLDRLPPGPLWVEKQLCYDGGHDCSAGQSYLSFPCS